MCSDLNEPVTVVIPLYNKVDTISRAVESVLTQSYPHWELVIVNDGSTDASLDRLAVYQDARLRILTQENQGPGAARNRGLAEAQTRLVAFLDADDQWEPWYLANAVSAWKENDTPLIVSMYTEYPGERSSRRELQAFELDLGRFQIDETSNPRQIRCLISLMKPWNCLCERESILKFGGFVEQRCTYGEDQTLFMRLGLNLPFTLIGPEAVRYHTEDSDLSGLVRVPPLPPYLKDPQTALQHCPESMKRLLSAVLDIFALSLMETYIAYGRRDKALGLLRRFPGTRRIQPDFKNMLIRLIPGLRVFWNLKRRLRNTP